MNIYLRENIYVYSITFNELKHGTIFVCCGSLTLGQLSEELFPVCLKVKLFTSLLLFVTYMYNDFF